jgi:hypothetical protein
MKTRIAIALLALVDAIAAEAREADIDFSSTKGLEITCRQFSAAEPRKLTQDRQKVAYAICSGIDLVRDVGTWLPSNKSNLNLQSEATLKTVRTRLEQYLVKIRTSRRLLESVTTNKPLFVIEPGNWELDLDGDGTIVPSEKYFFWTPKRGTNIFAPRESFRSDEIYYETNFVRPKIKIDGSDIYWATAYCHFSEAAINLLLSYDFKPDPFQFQMRDATRVKTVAYKNLLEGLKYSRKLRDSLTKETDDDAEWIPNPRQKNTSFPLIMDEQTFSTWGAFLDHMNGLLLGKTLLGGAVESREFSGVRDLAMGVCAPEEGINLRDLFLKPVQNPLDSKEWSARCVKANAATPFSGLASMIAESIKRNSGKTPDSISGEWMILRHFYWVN